MRSNERARAVRALVAAAALAGAGCAAPHEGFNPHADYRRAPAPGADDGEEVRGASFVLACHAPGGGDAARAALEAALGRAGGGRVVEVEGPARAALLARLFATAGPFGLSEARVARYEARVRARAAGVGVDMAVVWLDGDGTRIDLNAADAPARLVDRGRNEFQLVIDGGRIELPARLAALSPAGEGTYRCSEPPFALYKLDGERGQRIPLDVLDEQATLAPPPDVLLLEVREFRGDLTRFLFELCGGVAPRAGGGGTAFTLLGSQLWLRATPVAASAAPADEAPADEAPADEAPADEAPADAAPAEGE